MEKINVGDKFSTNKGEIVDVLSLNMHKENPFKYLCQVTRKETLSCSAKNKPDIVRYYSENGISEYGSTSLHLKNKIFSKSDVNLALTLLI